MKTLDLGVTYYERPHEAGVSEAQILRRTLQWQLPLDQTAFILVDVWSEHCLASHLERTHQITVERIVPVLEGVRRTGGLVVHAPGPGPARRYPDHLEEEVGGPVKPKADWPSQEFRRKEGDCTAFARPKLENSAEFDRISKERDIEPAVMPVGDDRVVANGEALHRLLERRGVTFLIYVGFAANICVPFKDYGTRAMKDRGYDIILVEDCTTAVEVSDTTPDLLLTRAATIDAALNVGYTVHSAALLKALG
jgi:nicotinamidase-related amidase